jgi:hypothetical protein
VPVDDDEGAPEEGGEVKKVLNHQPNRGFEGTDYTKGARSKPVEFEKRTLQEDNAFSQAGLHDKSQIKKKV